MTTFWLRVLCYYGFWLCLSVLCGGLTCGGLMPRRIPDA